MAFGLNLGFRRSQSSNRNPMAIIHRFPKPSLSISKIAAILLSTAAVAFVLARFAVPYFIAAGPLLWSSILFFLSPPYLFITVHVIIVAIWKLSDQNPNGKPSTAASVDEMDNRNATPLKTVTAESDAVTPGSVESCVTTDSEEEKAVSSRLEFEDEEAEDTWREVMMKKNATWERSSDAAVAAAAADVAAEIDGEQVVRRSATMKESTAEGNEEMNRRFEEFIKKNYDQIRSY